MRKGPTSPRGRPHRRRHEPLPPTPVESAKAASCRYVDTSEPGIRRVRCGRGFRYLRCGGAVVRDRATLHRIARLVIPPAWTDVWICPAADGHVQATGRDARRRKQYRYHARFRDIREETKYEHMLAFAEALPHIRARVDRDLSRPGLVHDRVLATVVRLLDTTLIRVGNEEYARSNDSFGLTTMRTRHVVVDRSTIRFRFRGKSKKDHVITVMDRRLARIVARCTDLPGDVLFQYLDEDGRRRSVEAAEVNDYIRRIANADFTAKDFRTWAGTVLAARALVAIVPRGAAATNKRIVQAVKDVAARLGNTPSVCRKCYVHPEIWTAHDDGRLVRVMPADPDGGVPRADSARLSPDEMAVRMLLCDRSMARPPPRPCAISTTTDPGAAPTSRAA